MSRNILQASLVALSVVGAPAVLAQESTPRKVEQIVSGDSLPNAELQKNLEQLLSCESGGGCFGPAGLHLGIVNGTTAIVYNGFDPQDPRKASYISLVDFSNSLVDFSNLIGATPSKKDIRRALEQFVRDTKTHPETTIHLEEEVVAGVQVGNTMKDLVVMNDGTPIDQLRIRGGVEASTLRGMVMRAGVTSELGSSGAVSVDIRVGDKEREILTQLGFEVSDGMMVKVSFAHLEQFMQFAFSDETLSHTMKQNTLGLSLRIPGNEVFRFFELSGYVIHAGSHDFADKYYTIDLGTMEESWRLRRRAAGSKTVGGEVTTQIALGEDGRSTLYLSGGVEQTKSLTLDHSAAQVSPTGGARLNFPVTENINGHVQVRGSRGMSRGEIGGTYGKSQFGVFTEQQSGQQRNTGIAFSLRGGNTDAMQNPTENPGQKDIFANMSLPTYTVPDGRITDYVTTRPNWVPTQVRAKADEKRELVRRTLKNQGPTAVNDTATVVSGNSVLVNALANDTDPENDALSLVSFTQGAHGTVVRVGNQLRYTSDAGYTGPDTFTYIATDGTTNSSPATVNMTVSAGLVDHAEVVTLPTPTITATGITFAGGSVTDVDNPGGYMPIISYIVTDASNNTVSASSLTPNTAYAWQMSYATYDGATNTLTVKKTAKQNFTTLDVAPVENTVLSDISVGDQAGNPITIITNALSGVTDPLGRTLQVVSISGLPSTDGFGEATNFTYDANGVINGIYDVGSYTVSDPINNLGAIQSIIIQIVIKPIRGTQSLIRNVTILISNQG